ncbi:hypothetical protein DPMN_060692 [Dreissena polymorpha]|uniref:Uncharacterized protein n=1 Tax=Dreissena polymorpha TaxID=45954 RepID=A0A9D4C5P4_DREPO|nr:hypothetical protein DPMN_060692 [Dreissena polymorpha]
MQIKGKTKGRTFKSTKGKTAKPRDEREGQKDRLTDGQSNIRTERLTVKQSYEKKNNERDGQKYRESERQTERWIDTEYANRSIDRQTDLSIKIQNYRDYTKRRTEHRTKDGQTDRTIDKQTDLEK